MSEVCCDPQAQEQIKQEKVSIPKKLIWLGLSLAFVIPFEILSFASIDFPLWFELPIFLLLIVIFGREVFQSGIKSLLKLDFSDINLLMTIAVIGALYLHEFEEAAIIVILFAIGEALEDYGIEKSKGALSELVEKAPKSALLKGQENKVPIEQIKVNDIVVVKPGDQVPLDGKVIVGESTIDEAAITGEPLPKSKHIGDMVYAGTINTTGYIEVEVTKESKDSTLAKIIDLTFSAAEKKSKSQKFIENFSKYYTPFIVVASILLVLIPVGILQQPLTPWLTQALTLLIISCPCALVISTPISIFSAIGNATQKGVLIKGGRFIEEIGKIKAVALDKTRTLTKGVPVVSDVITFNGVSKEELLACAAGMEHLSQHPIAVSIVEKAKELGLQPHEFSKFESVSGKGLMGDCLICNTKHHCMGNMKFVSEEHGITEEIKVKIEELEKQGKTAIVMSDATIAKGIIAVTDEIRPESKIFIESLKALNVIPVILTGDNSSAAQYVANTLEIEEVHGELLPDGKVGELNKLIGKYGNVAMVGDGVNDAPALATSSVGIAMGAIGSDVAIENADIALMNDNLQMVPYLIELGRKCVSKIQFNTYLAVVVKATFLVLAFVGLSNLAFAIFADVGITVLVVLNSLRLYNFQAHKITVSQTTKSTHS